MFVKVGRQSQYLWSRRQLKGIYELPDMPEGSLVPKDKVEVIIRTIEMVFWVIWGHNCTECPKKLCKSTVCSSTINNIQVKVKKESNVWAAVSISKYRHNLEIRVSFLARWKKLYSTRHGIWRGGWLLLLAPGSCNKETQSTFTEKLT